MMKKLGMIALVMTLVVAFALPAFAYVGEDGKGNKFMLGGTVITDIGYWNRSLELTGTGNDQTQFFLTVPTNSNFRGFLEAGDAGAYWEIGMGFYATGLFGSGVGSTNYVETRKLYGYYKFGNMQLLAGKTDGWFYTIAPGQRLGVSENLHFASLGWGANYDGRYAQVRLTQNVSKQFGYAISLVSPTTVVDSTRTSYASFPLIAAKLNLNFGVVMLYPAVYYTQIKWDALPSGYDDSVTSWMAMLPLMVKTGPFTGMFQVGYGQNIFQGISAQPINFTYQTYQRLSTGAIKDTTALNGFIDLAYTIGPITPHIYFGYDQAKNSDAWKVGDDNNTRMMYGINATYSINQNFTVGPEFTLYDWGKKPNTAGSPNIGTEWIGGVQFRFNF